MAKNDNLKDFLTDVADAIRAKKGSTGLINPQNFSAEIASIETGGGGGEGGGGGADDVRFIDYDGTILHSFSKDDFLALAEMPPLPSQPGLTCQGWNWSLADAQDYVEKYGAHLIGATYITDDGKTRLYIRIAEHSRLTMSLGFFQTVANGVTINWGDGSEEVQISGTGNKLPAHTYNAPGDYIITMDVAEGCSMNLGHDSSSYAIFGLLNNNTRCFANRLLRVEIGKNVESITRYTFDSCLSLEYITIPQGVTTIGVRAFYENTSLSAVVLPSTLTSLGEYAFYYSYSVQLVSLPLKVTKIGTSAFEKCRSLRMLYPGGCSSIGANALMDCGALRRIAIPDSVVAIGANAFKNCGSLTEVTIPDSVTTIGANAFENCYSLGIVHLPKGLTALPASIFSACNSLRRIVLPDSLTSMGERCFSTCYSLQEIVIPEGVASVPNYAFQYCEGLESIIFPAKSKVVNSYTLSNCRSLRTFSFPEGATGVMTYGFQTCFSLEYLKFPSTFTTISANAFASCYGIKCYDFSDCTAVPTLSATSAFNNRASDCVFVVPDELYDSWIAASNWSYLASYIVKASEFNG